MDDYTAVGIAEGFVDADDEEQVLAAWQHIYNNKLHYGLQGFFGRTIEHLLEQGLIEP